MNNSNSSGRRPSFKELIEKYGPFYSERTAGQLNPATGKWAPAIDLETEYPFLSKEYFDSLIKAMNEHPANSDKGGFMTGASPLNTIIGEPVPQIRLRPALCLDLDGTIRYSVNGDFINSPEDVALFPDVEEKLWEYRDRDYLIIGVTNQGGVAYGLKTPQGSNAEIKATLDAFGRSPFHWIYSCLFHPGGSLHPYNHRSLFRKPQIGMLALAELDARQRGMIIDWDRSLFVGDRPEDEECARSAGIEFQWAHQFFERPQQSPA